VNWIEVIQSVFDITLLSTTSRVSVPLIFASLGGLLSERSGVLNLGVEGMMLVGACLAALGSHFSGSPWIGLLAALAAGAVMGLIHSYISVTWQGDQGISGLALFILSVGVTGFLLQVLFHHGGDTPRVATLPVVQLDFLKAIPVLDRLFNRQPALVYVSFLLPFVVHFFFYHTHWGSWVRATGDNPRALAVVGVSPIVVRYLSVVSGGMLAAMGGAYLSISQMSLFTEQMTAGRGFIALSAIIFGNWKPIWTFVAALFFGFMDAMQLTLQITVPDRIIPRQIFMALPYLLTVAVLAGFVAKAVPPASIGQPYEKEGR